MRSGKGEVSVLAGQVGERELRVPMGDLCNVDEVAAFAGTPTLDWKDERWNVASSFARFVAGCKVGSMDRF